MTNPMTDEALRALGQPPGADLLEPNARINIKIRATSGYSGSFEGRSTAQQWIEINQIMAGQAALHSLAAELITARARITALEAWIAAEAEDRGDADAGYPIERQCAGILHAATKDQKGG